MLASYAQQGKHACNHSASTKITARFALKLIARIRTSTLPFIAPFLQNIRPLP